MESSRKSIVDPNKSGRIRQNVGVFLLELPLDILLQVLPAFLGIDGLTRLRQTCTFFYVTHQDAFNKLIDKKVKQLLEYVVCGELEKVESMIKAPHLLLLKNDITYRSILIKDVSAYQLAHMMNDFAYNKTAKEMVEMMNVHVSNLTSQDQDLANRQLMEIYPQDYQQKNKHRIDQDLEALDKVIQAIKDSKSEEDCQTEIRSFKLHLKQSHHTKLGQFFNGALFIKALNHEHLGPHEFDQASHYKQKLIFNDVVCAIMYYAPMCFINTFFNGFSNLIRDGYSLVRKFKLSLADDSIWYSDNIVAFDISKFVNIAQGLNHVAYPPNYGTALQLIFEIKDEKIKRCIEKLYPEQEYKNSNCFIQ